MKTLLRLTVFTLSLLAFVSTAHSKNAQANGTFDFSLGDVTGVIVFDADSNDAGAVTGQMSFTATVEIGDPEGVGDTVLTDVAVEAQFDCLLVDENFAAMSGVVTSASAPAYVGQQVLLVVVDKLAGIQPPTDAFAWGVYKPNAVNLAAKDNDLCPTLPPAESGYEPDEDQPLPPCIIEVIGNDQGASMTWTATDYELCPTLPPAESGYEPDPDQPLPPCIIASDPNAFTAGIPTTPTVVDCESFPLLAYPLNLIPRGHGNKVQVKHHP